MAPQSAQLTISGTSPASSASESTVRSSIRPPAAESRAAEVVEVDLHLDQRHGGPERGPKAGWQLVGGARHHVARWRGPGLAAGQAAPANHHAGAGHARKGLKRRDRRALAATGVPVGGAIAGPIIAEATPDVICAGGSRVRTSTRRPRSARHTAVLKPTTPAPITTTSAPDRLLTGSSSHSGRCARRALRRHRLGDLEPLRPLRVALGLGQHLDEQDHQRDPHHDRLLERHQQPGE